MTAALPRPLSYPFTAIVGQQQMRLALLLNAVEPRIGGVLIRGEKGTAKSTMARALAELLPELRVVAGCRYNCSPDDLTDRCVEHSGGDTRWEIATRPMQVVELPSNTTEDRLAGTIDIQAVLTRGEARFQPGLLAEAHRGILYVDEVNLLADHLVDLLLDAAAMGRHSVEREGLSVSHPARFILIGTMNPEEGELRPQLLDRFGLCVEIKALADVDARVEVMRRRAAYEADAAAFVERWRAEQDALRAQVIAARQRLGGVRVSDEILRLVAGLALEMKVDGHRADIVMLRAATAIAAFEGHAEVTADDVRRAAELALPHRLRRRPFEQERFSEEQLQEALDRLATRTEEAEPGEQPPTSPSAPPPPAAGERPEERRADPGPPPALPSLELERDRTPRGGSGRRQRSTADDHRGRFVRAALPSGPAVDVALGATVRAAASRPASEGAASAAAVAVRPEDLRVKVRERKVGAAIVFIVDASGSMGAKRRMEAAKGAALALLTDAYQRRDRVALIAFRDAGAETLLPLTDSVELVQRRLAVLLTGGRTPLAAGLQAGLELMRVARLKDPRALCVPVLITDGRANAGRPGQSPIEEALAVAEGLRGAGTFPLVLDGENDFLSFGLARRLAERAGARYLRLADLSPEAVAGSVRALYLPS